MTRNQLGILIGVLAACLAMIVLVAVSPHGQAYGQEGAAPGVPAAQYGTAFTYHGRLVRSGEPYDGTCSMGFRLYDSSTFGMQIGSPVTQTVTLAGGLFAATLDFGPGSFDGHERWLAIRVLCADDPGFTELPLRQPINPSPYAMAAGSGTWSGVTGLPAGLADGVDDDTQYRPGQGLTLSGSTFDVDPSLYQRRVGTLCEPGKAMSAIGQDGIPVCDETYNGDITAVRVISGLLGGGSVGDVTINADPAYLQLRVTDTCTTGQWIAGIDASGNVTCEIDSNSVYTAGNQLQLVGNEFSVIDGSGSDLDADTLDGSGPSFFRNAANFSAGTLGRAYYSAWDDLGAEGYLDNADGDLAQNNGITQTNLSAALVDGRAPAYLLNASNIKAGTLGTDFYSAYGDLSAEGKLGTAGGVAVNTRQLQPTLNTEQLDGRASTYFQRRVTGVCLPGQAMTLIKPSGDVTCGSVAGGDISGVTIRNNTGLTGGGSSGIVTVAADMTYLQPRITTVCPPGSSITSFDASGIPVCKTDANSGGTVITVTASSGLSGGGSSGAPTVSADTTKVQARVSTACAANKFIQSIAQNGTPTCLDDFNMTYTASDGMELTGLQLNADMDAVMTRLPSTQCSTGNAFLNIDNSSGAVTCEPIPGGDITKVTADTGLTLSSGDGQSGDVTLSGNFSISITPEIHVGSNESHTDELTRKDTSVCVLRMVGLGDNDQTDDHYCRITAGTTYWQLEAKSGDDYQSDMWCSAVCFLWYTP